MRTQISPLYLRRSGCGFGALHHPHEMEFCGFADNGTPRLTLEQIPPMFTQPSSRGGFRGLLWKVPEAFCGERVAIRHLSTGGHYGIFFAAHRIATIDLTNKQIVSHVSGHVSPISPDGTLCSRCWVDGPRRHRMCHNASG
jgi:hypothetical protein